MIEGTYGQLHATQFGYGETKKNMRKIIRDLVIMLTIFSKDNGSMRKQQI